MKKRYIISMITILLITVSFFAYNKYSKNEIEENKIIGIYLEDDYGSNTYTLSDSSGIPDDEYIFNVEKTNENCPNATFSYDEVNNKIKINTNKSIQCNIYFKARKVEQLINYIMLYDNSYNDIQLNQMKDITNGWYVPQCASGYTNGNATFTNNGIVFSYSSNSIMSCVFAQSANIDLTNGSIMCAEVNMNSGTSFEMYTSDASRKTFNNSNYIYTLSAGRNFLCDEFTNPGLENSFVCLAQRYDIGGSGSSTVYKFAIFKYDDFDTLASKINVSVSSIDDLLNSYSTQLLNNEKAVKYMLKQCTGDFMGKAVTNTTFMNAYRNSPYKSLIDANVHWKKFIDIAS